MNIPDKETKWLKTFFSAPNKLSFNDVLNGIGTSDLLIEASTWLSEWVSNPAKIPLLLPRVDDYNLTWYACCEQRDHFSQVLEELTAYVGCTYSSITSIEHHPEKNTIEELLISRFGQNIVRVEVFRENHDECLKMIQLYRRANHQRPVRAHIGSRPVGKIRSDFEMALNAIDEQSANKYIAELKSTGRLNHQNQKFLEIRKLAALGKWRDIVVDPSNLSVVADLQLPPRILADLIESLYQVYILKHETNNSPAAAVSQFKEQVKRRYGKLFRTRKDIKYPNVLKAFLIYELTRDEPSTDICKKLIDAYPKEDSGYAFALSLSNLIAPEPVSIDYKELAGKAELEEQYDYAFELYLKCEMDVSVLAGVIKSAYWSESQESLKKAWELATGCSEEIISSLPPKSLQIYNKIKKQFESPEDIINDWVELVRYIHEGGDIDIARRAIEQGEHTWSINQFLKSSELVQKFSLLLMSAWESQSEFIREILPKLYECFVSNALNNQIILKPIYKTLLFVLACSDSISNNDAELSEDLIIISSDCGLSDSEYSGMVDEITNIWNQIRSYAYINWALDICELLLSLPRPDFGPSLNLFNDVLLLVSESKHRLNEQQWDILEIIAGEYNCSDHIEKIRPKRSEGVESDEVFSSKFEGKKIGIYTLMEQAGIRAKAFIERMYSGVTVETNNDHEATERLINLVKSADIFIFAWRCSKHQAFYCIKNNKGTHTQLLQARGKGTSSIIGCLLDEN